MKTFTIETIRSFKPCYDPAKHLPENWTGTALDILNHKTIPDTDKLWVVLRPQIIEEKTLRLFAVSCARHAMSKLTTVVDKRVVDCIDTVEKFALGLVDDAALSAALSAADSAAYSAAYSAARSAAYSAAYSAADSAARSAARSAADSAAYSAALSAADSAALSAADSAALSAAYSAAYSAALSAADSAAVQSLISLLTLSLTNEVRTNLSLSGIKHDDGKPDMSLLSSIAMTEVSKVMTFGKKKYSAHNWRGGFIWSRPLSAGLRHIFAFIGGEDNDPETGLSHLAHAICCLMFVLEFTVTKAGTDDRYKIEVKNDNNKK